MRNWGRLFPVRDWVADGVYKAAKQAGISHDYRELEDETKVFTLTTPDGASVQVIVVLLRDARKEDP